MDKICFIGGINAGNPPRGGAEAKNQILLKELKRRYGSEEIVNYDVSINRENPILAFLGILRVILLHNRLVFSVPSTALIKIAFLNFLLKRKKITIFVIGGDIHEMLYNKRLMTLLKMACVVYGETQKMVNYILTENKSIKAKYLPNFKYLPEGFLFPNRNIGSELKLLYLSRINHDKGIFRCFEIMERLKEKDPNTNYILDIYGVFDLTKKERLFFDQYLELHSNIRYKGIINLNDEKGYIHLAQYYLMLFLTNHPGEGFPGALIDSIIAHVPVIASDWKYNAEILCDEVGFLGELIKIDHMMIDNSVKSIIYFRRSAKLYENIQIRMKEKVKEFDIKNIEFNLC